jgi:hypothetical protein
MCRDGRLALSPVGGARLALPLAAGVFIQKKEKLVLSELVPSGVEGVEGNAKNRQKCSKITKNDKKCEKLPIFPINHLISYMKTTYNNPHSTPIPAANPFSRCRNGDAFESMNNEQRTVSNLTPYPLTKYASCFTSDVVVSMNNEQQTMNRTPKTMNFAIKNSVNQCKSVSKRQLSLYICRVPSTNPTFLCKTNPILCVFNPKTTISLKNKPNSNPIQTQMNPILNEKCTIRGVYPDLSGQNKPNFVIGLYNFSRSLRMYFLSGPTRGWETENQEVPIYRDQDNRVSGYYLSMTHSASTGDE